MITPKAPKAPVAVARRQLGLATRHQLTATAGIPDATITSRTRPGGPWQRLLPRVYLLQTGPPDRRQRALAAVLYAAEPTADPLSGDTAALTGAAALALLGIRDTPSAPVDVLIRAPRRLTATPQVRPLPTARWPRTITVSGIPSTRPVRAAADYAARAADHPDRIRSVLAQVVQAGWCHPQDLHAELRASRLLTRPAVRAAAAELLAGVRSIAEARARDTLTATDLPTPPVERPPLHPGRHVPGQPGRLLARRGRGPGDRLGRVPLHPRRLARHPPPPPAPGIPRHPGRQRDPVDDPRHPDGSHRSPPHPPHPHHPPPHPTHSPSPRPRSAVTVQVT